jgi:hypothetical protein
VLGVPVIAALALLGEAMHIGGSQFLVGAGMGLALGVMQARALRGVVDKPFAWIASCTVGLAAPFVVADISRAAHWDLPYSLPVFIALGGFIVGAWQASILKTRLSGTASWVVASAVGWTLAGAAALMSDTPQLRAIRGLAGALAYLGVIAVGGLILGLVTGAALAWMLKRV